jgi:flagellar biosynthesis anti-sigma factor FlgM
MTINPVNTPNPAPPVLQSPEAPAQTHAQAKAQAGAQAQVNQNQQTEAQAFIANSRPVPAQPEPNQTVQLSATTQQLMQAAKTADANNEFDQKKVDRLRKSIAEGTYAVNNKQLASKFLELEKLLGKQGAT